MNSKEEEEILRIAKKMDKMVQKKNAAGALDLLKELKNMPMTLELLQSTRIGMPVNAIRKQSTDEEVTSLAKSLIKSWKKLLDGPSNEKEPEEKKKEPLLLSQNSPEAREESSSSSNFSSRKEVCAAFSDNFLTTLPRAPITSDSVRLKCRELLSAALKTGDDYITIGADDEELGAQIEEAIFQDFKNTDMKYKNRIRSRISNLKDAKNPNLRRSVLCGNIAPDVFARMSAENRYNFGRDSEAFRYPVLSAGLSSVLEWQLLAFHVSSSYGLSAESIHWNCTDTTNFASNH
ncbi:transcription elongation factor A protein 1 isoform X2 [Rhinatrema bivittatum]|uniref:transcription elongation factor A protein 1 isoform X2 n=1 Tax=Rhinatrema bivittatum TaxID=194408 RepID=UPI0011288D99|nr:transcription elongation factor A protein 1 isoform X2 [Rhinatrema bivittatum]